MNKKEYRTPVNFITDVNNLYNEIDNWLRSQKLSTTREKKDISEEAYGQYSIDQLIISDSTGSKVATLTPVGAGVIGAKGRVDVVGILDRIILVKLEKGGPQISTSVKSGEYTERNATQLFKGISKDGWYWIESKRLRKARLLDKNLFFDLISEVSDYEFD